MSLRNESLLVFALAVFRGGGGGLYKLVVWGLANSLTYLFAQNQVEGRKALDFGFKLSCVLASIRQ